jgi:hypothetical protein
LTKWSLGVRRQSEAATAPSTTRDVQERQTLAEPKRCRAPLATALQSSLPETAGQTLSMALPPGQPPSSSHLTFERRLRCRGKYMGAQNSYKDFLLADKVPSITLGAARQMKSSDEPGRPAGRSPPSVLAASRFPTPALSRRERNCSLDILHANGVRARQPRATPWETSLRWHSPPWKGGGNFRGLRPFRAPECSGGPAFPGCCPGLICCRAFSACSLWTA